MLYIGHKVEIVETLPEYPATVEDEYVVVRGENSLLWIAPCDKLVPLTSLMEALI